MKKNRLTKITCVMVAFLFVFSALLSGDTAKAASKQPASKAKAAYQMFLKSEKTRKAYKHGMYGAIVKTSKDSSPVLLVTKSVYNDHGKLAISAKVYHYVDKKVVYIGKIESCGTSYPLCKKGSFLLAGTHHSSIKMTVDGSKATANFVDGMYMEKNYDKCYKKTLTYENGKSKENTSEKITSAQAEKLDYYLSKGGDYAGKPIKFKKY